MAKCEICGKGVTFGIKVSHSHRRTNRTWKPNVKRVKAVVNGTPCHIYACSRCLRSGKVLFAKSIWEPILYFAVKTSNWKKPTENSRCKAKRYISYV